MVVKIEKKEKIMYFQKGGETRYSINQKKKGGGKGKRRSHLTQESLFFVFGGPSKRWGQMGPEIEILEVAKYSKKWTLYGTSRASKNMRHMNPHWGKLPHACNAKQMQKEGLLGKSH